MRILMLAHRIPYPPHTGDKVRAYHVARHLAKGHELTLAFPIDDRADWAGLDPLRGEFRDLEFAGPARSWAGAPAPSWKPITYGLPSWSTWRGCCGS